MPFNPLRNPDQMQQLEGEDAGVQFSHSLEEQIGGQLEAGFILLSLYEDTKCDPDHLADLFEQALPVSLRDILYAK